MGLVGASPSQLAGLAAYLEGEQLCDAGETSTGMRRFASAFELAPELESEPWPAWAEACYRAGGARASVMVGRSGTAQIQPELRGGVSGDGYLRDDVSTQLSLAVSRRSFVILDDFASASALRAACEATYAAGFFHPPQAAAASRGGGRRQGGDLLCWLHPETIEHGWGTALHSLVARADAVAARLAKPMGIELGSRMRPMVSRYSRGAAFPWHVDANAGNGRVLSAVLYLAETWREADGGCLRLHPPEGSEAAGGAASGLADRPPESSPCQHAIDVAPLGGRMVFFAADARCPHEVLEVTSDAPRFAITLWYLSTQADRQAAGAEEPESP